MALNINGTTGISGVDASVSAPALTGTDSNTGISFPAADTIKFSAGGVEKLSITASGLSGDGSGLTGIGGGKILQVISQESTTGFATTSSTFVDVFDFTATITASASTSKILVMASSNMECDGSNNRSFATIRRDSTNLGHSSGGLTQMHEYYYPGAQDQEMPCTMIYLDSPGDTNAHTYKVQIRLSGGTRAGWNGAQTATKGSFIVMEVGA